MCPEQKKLSLFSMNKQCIKNVLRLFLSGFRLNGETKLFAMLQDQNCFIWSGFFV